MAHGIHLEALPYQPDSAALFEALRPLPWALLLDSGFPHSRAGRFDIMTADPVEQLSFIVDKSTTYDDIARHFVKLAEAHAHYCGGGSGAPTIPFWGGLAGWLDYGVGSPLQRIPAREGARADLHIYGWAVVQDHHRQQAHFAALPSTPAATRRAVLERLRECMHSHPTGDFALQTPFTANMDRAAYRRALARVRGYIEAGDCYQVNIARRFSARYRGDPWVAYQMLRPLAAAHYSAYLRGGGAGQQHGGAAHQRHGGDAGSQHSGASNQHRGAADQHSGADRHLLCLSPEQFLQVSGGRVQTRPIKGTCPRHPDDLAADRAAGAALQQSPKNRAENLMIVDLLRNDIGRNCRPGSIRAERLFELESYPAVHHLVSTVTGDLLPGRGALDLLRDSFPGGSITGAPKRRAMQIIDALEPQGRGGYCGSALYINANGGMDSNIAIRALVCEGGDIHCWGGGGIVADSVWQQEYDETWDKVGAFINALENTLHGSKNSVQAQRIAIDNMERRMVTPTPAEALVTLNITKRSIEKGTASKDFRHFIETTQLDDGQEWAVAVFSAERMAQMGMTAEPRVLRLSSLSVAKRNKLNQEAHRDRWIKFDQDDWNRVQRMIDHGSWAVNRIRHRAIWMREDDKLWFLVIAQKRTGELYLDTIFAPRRKDYIERERPKWHLRDVKDSDKEGWEK